MRMEPSLSFVSKVRFKSNRGRLDVSQRPV